MRGRSASPYLFLAFPVAILTVFTVGPTILGLGLGFFDWSGSGPARFVGLGNFRSLVNDSRFWPALR
ncbi:MAG: sugar ABC transporter permease, partial [Phycisphaerae bacterium]|nr:sugar ABC transporter permease [Phycisphaerae bacterium]